MPLPVSGSFEEYLRVLQVAGLVQASRPASFMVRPLVGGGADHPTTDPTNPWSDEVRRLWADSAGAGRRLALDPLRIGLSGNSAYPAGANDRAQWQGKGLNLVLEGGATSIFGPLRVTVRPILFYAQNLAFPLAPVSIAGAGASAYPWRKIDLPQRMGSGAYTAIDPGQSTISLSGRGIAIEFGTGNLWWGPGRQKSILMSDNAAGFPHVMVGSTRPLDVRVGSVEGEWLWGRLQDSRWVRGGDAGLGRFFTGAIGVFSPSFLKGLSLGAGRTLVMDRPPGGFRLSDYLVVLQPASKKSLATPDNPSGDDQRDQIISLLARWVLPASGFEAYGEWARNDHSWDLRDLLLEPEHSQGYTLGFQKVETLSGGALLSIGGELTHLEQDRTVLLRDTPVFYAHHLVERGYTQRGQIIGAAVGPGGDGQSLSTELYTRKGGWILLLERVVHDNDAYYDGAVGSGTALCCHDVSWSVRSRAHAYVSGFDVGIDLMFTRELNRYFVQWNDVSNLNAGLSLEWRP